MMCYFRAVLLLLITFTITINAQLDSACLKNNSFNNPYAVYLSVDGFEFGGALGGKYKLLPETTLRFYISLTNSAQTYNQINNTGQAYTEKYETNSLLPGIAIEQQLFTSLGISPYLGGGFGYGWAFSKKTLTNSLLPENSRQTTNYWLATVFLGIEYSISRRVSFAFEQSLSYQSSNSEVVKKSEFRNSVSTILLMIYF